MTTGVVLLSLFLVYKGIEVGSIATVGLGAGALLYLMFTRKP